MKKLIVLLLVAGILCLTVFLFMSTAAKGTLLINNLQEAQYVTVNNTPYDVTGDSITIPLIQGSYEVKINGPMLKDTLIELIEIKPSTKTTLIVQAEAIDVNQLVNKLVEKELVANNLSISQNYLSQNKNWLIIRLYSMEGSQDGYTNVYRYSVSDGWKLIESGTGIDTKTLEANGLPIDCVDFLEGSRK